MNTELAKCSCQHCGGHLEFEIAYAGEHVACPHCGNETRLYVPVEATTLGVPYSSPAPPEPAAQAAYRLANEHTAPPPVPRAPAVRPPSRRPHDTNPFAQLARASFVSFIGMFVLAYFGQYLTSPMKDIFYLIALLFLAISFSLGIAALVGIRKYGTRGILIPALFGIVVNGLFLAVVSVGVYTRWVERRPQGSGSSARPVTPLTNTQTESRAPVARPDSDKKSPRPGEPVVKLLEPGTEPRKVLRLQPKAGDKQTVAFTMKMAMEPGPFADMPPVVETTEITIQKVFPSGDIVYESVIKDFSVMAGAGTPARALADMKAVAASAKGLITSGVVSSRGYSRWTEIKHRKSDKALPAIVRMLQGTADMALHNILLPEEAIGAGGKWEVRSESQRGVGTVVYEIASIEENRVTARVASTVSGSNQNAKGPVMTGDGSGEMTIDLARIIPTKANFVYRMDDPQTGQPGGTKPTMKMRMELRIEAK